MRQIKGFLCGHYDSRGGSSFVTASTKEEAAKKYFKFFYDPHTTLEDLLGGDNDFSTEVDFVGDDLMGEAILHVPDSFDEVTLDGLDLEHFTPDALKDVGKLMPPDGGPYDADAWQAYWEMQSKLPVLGKVVAPGRETEFVDTDEGGDFYDNMDVNNIIELEFVPTGSLPQVVTPFCHPRWDDDAYSFVFLQ